jgi:hypothetical protein
MGGASVDAGSITFDSGGTIMTDSGGLLVLDSCAEFNYGGILVDGGGTLDLHGCALSIGTLILCDGVLDLNGGQPSPDARKAEGVRPVARYKFDAEGNIVPVRKRRRRHRRPSEGVDDSPGDAQ